MSRLDYVTIAIVAVCVAALIYLIYMTTGLLGGGGDTPPAEAPAEEAPYYDDYYPDEDSLAYEDDYGADSLSAGGDAYTQDRIGEDGQSGRYEDAQEDTYAPAAERPAATEDYPSVRSGEYMLLAGTFKYKANAEAMVQQLKKMGYSNASVELFNRGAYAVALVDRYSSLSEARTARGELSGKGVEAFVKQKQ